MKRSFLYPFSRFVALSFFRIFMPYRVIHPEYVPQNGRVIVCCNHLSMKDPVLIAALSWKRQFFFMAKAELFRNWFIGAFLHGLGAFSVHRGAGDSGAINTAKQLLDEEQAIGIFIEGTRSKDGNFLQPKSGAVMLAHDGNAPILPVCITAPKGIFPRLFHRVIVSCGKPIPPEELGITKASGSEYRKASRYVMSRIAELRERDLGGERA